MKFKFDLYQKIYHITPESPSGVILDRRIYPDIGRIEYLVTFSYNDEAWCVEQELSENKIII